MNTSAAIILKDFSGFPEITPGAYELKKNALAKAAPIVKVETEQEQMAAVAALKDLKDIRTGMEATRKAVKAPVLALSKKIDSTAETFTAETDKEELRLQGLINHFQRKQREAKEAEEKRIQREQAEALRLEEEAKRKREEAERTNDPKLKAEAAEIEQKAFEKGMANELAPTVTVENPRGLVVKSRMNYQITDPIAFCIGNQSFLSWHADTETLKVKRREVLEDINRENGALLIKPAGIRIFDELKSHVR